MPWNICLVVLFAMSMSVVAGERQQRPYGPADVYPAHQVQGGVTVSVRLIGTGCVIERVFGKINPAKLGIVPLSMVIQNDGTEAIRTEVR